jgi:hypothetical protein
MAGIKIHQYPLERTSIGDNDYYDIDYWTGSSYQSAKIKGSTLKNVLGADYIDITTFISGYELTDKDAGKLITNSNANVRTLVIPSGLALPNNMVTVKGRIAIQPETSVNITLPDGSIITDPTQFTCVADEVYILHKSAFTGDNYILVSVKKSENIGTNDLIITDTIRELQVATDGTFQIVTNDTNNSAIFRVGENSNERFSEIEFNTVIFDLVSKFQNPSITTGVIVEVNPNEFKFIVLPNTSNTSVYHGLISVDANKTIIEKSNAGKFLLDSSLSSNTFEDLRATKKGLEYSADYSANFSVRSLVDKAYVDNEVSTKIGAVIEDTTPQLGGDLDLNNNDINGTGNIDITGNVISDIVQLRGGTGTQGEMSWNTDEETVQLVMDGTTLHIGQDTFVHARNNTASIITKGTAVYATGTLGASGRITVAPMIANGTIPGRLFIGLAAEDIAIGADGQVCSYGKIRQINTTAYNDGDVLWLSPTVAGQLTTTEPSAPNLKIATAFVIHAATNGTLMVRAEQGNDLHSDQRVQVSGLTNNDVLTWSNANQRWQNAQPVLPNWGSIGGTLSAQTDLQTALNAKENSITAGTTGQYWRGDKTFQTLDKTAVGLGNVDNTTDANKPISTATQTALNLKLNIADAYGGKRYTLIKPNGTKEFYDTLTQVRSNWADGDVLHQFADETDITYVDNGSGYMFTLPSIAWNGNGFQVKVSNILTSGEAYVLLVGKTAYLSNLRLGGQGANVSSVALINGTLYCDDNTFISIDIENNKSSSLCLNLAGTMYGGNIIANGDGEAATLPQGGIGGAGTCINVNTRGFQSGSLTNFFGGSTTYSVATNYKNVYCNFGNQQIGNGKTFDHCYIYSTRNNNGANQSVFVARNCTIIHVPASNLNTFYNIAAITMIDCVFISAGYLCASFGSVGSNLIQGGYHSFANQTNYGAHNYSSLLTIVDCTIEATNANATTDVLLLNNSNATNVKINNVTFKNAGGRSDIRTIPANNVEWKNCRFSKGSAHISVSSGTVADAYNNNPARLTDPKGFLNNTGNGNWFMYVPMTTAERDLLTSVSAGFVIRNTTTNFLQVYNGSTWKDLLNLT